MKISMNSTRLVFCLLVTVLFAGSLNAQSINVPTLEIAKGTTANLALSYVAGGGATNFDFTLTYDPVIIDEASIGFLCDKDIVGLSSLDCTVDLVNNQVKGIGTNLVETGLESGEFAIINLPVYDTAVSDSYIDPFAGHFADATTVALLDTTWTLHVITDFCNLNVYSGVTESSPNAMFEACESLIIGPTFTAEDGASIMLSSGLDIELSPGVSIKLGASLDAAVCGQSLCEASPDPMPDGCHSCVVEICDISPSCCDTEFTQACVDMVGTTCNLECQ